MHTHDLKLNDLLSDPLVRLVMASDGVEEAHIRTLARRIALRQPPSALGTGERLGAAGYALRHTPSCRKGWPGSLAQPCA